ncbi:MAG: ABC transporter permease [Anaerolineales bacterium]|nr:ABC transporter permease [Anaerolineales bacterium]
MKILAVARKSLIELLREPMLMGMVLLTPLAFLLVYGFAYQTPHLKTYRVLATIEAEAGNDAVEYLRSLTYPDGRPVFAVEIAADPVKIDPALRDRAAAAFLTIEPGTNGVLFSYTLRGDALFADFLSASSILESRLSGYLLDAEGISLPVRVVENSIPALSFGTRTDFSVYAPGLLVFAVLLLVPQTALLLGREMRTRTIRRLQLSGVSSVEWLGGIGLSQLVMAVLQIILFLIGLMLFGLDYTRALIPIFVASFLTALSAVGAGLVVGCFIQNDSQAVNLGASVTMLQVFISGSFFPMPLQPLFHLFGHEIAWNDAFPATHAMIALQQAVTYGADLSRIGFRLAAAAVLSVMFFLAGALLFQWKVFRAAKSTS